MMTLRPFFAVALLALVELPRAEVFPTGYADSNGYVRLDELKGYSQEHARAQRFLTKGRAAKSLEIAEQLRSRNGNDYVATKLWLDANRVLGRSSKAANDLWIEYVIAKRSGKTDLEILRLSVGVSTYMVDRKDPGYEEALGNLMSAGLSEDKAQDNFKVPPQNALTALLSASLAEQDISAEVTREICLSQLKRDPSNWAMHMYYSSALTQAHGRSTSGRIQALAADFPAARKEAEACIKLRPKNCMSWYVLAQATYFSDVPTACNALREYLRLGGDVNPRRIAAAKAFLKSHEK